MREAFENADADVAEEYEDGTCDWGFGHQNILEVINSVPAADVAPVRHGRWIHTTIEDDDWGSTFHSWACSNCDFSTGQNQNGTNYCPNCGARMDLEEPNETKET